MCYALHKALCYRLLHYHLISMYLLGSLLQLIHYQFRNYIHLIWKVY